MALARSGARIVGPLNAHDVDEWAATVHDRTPWMGDLTAYLMRRMRSRVAAGKPGLNLPPLLLVGAPGAGKSWYARVVGEIAGTPVREVVADPDFDPILELDENLEVQRRRRQAAMRAAPLLVDALTVLDTSLINGTLRIGCAPDPEFVAQHPGRVERAEARERVLHRALSGIEVAFRDRGHTVVLFGSLLEGRVHGRSDLDLVVLGEMSREAQRELWDAAERIAREQGIEVDLHFPDLYSGDFLDRLKVIRGGQIVPLRDLIAATRNPKTQAD